MVEAMKNQPLTHRNNCVYDLSYHMVLVTKRRKRLLDAEVVRDYIRAQDGPGPS